jgi:hypothetical protein
MGREDINLGGTNSQRKVFKRSLFEIVFRRAIIPSARNQML